MNEPRRISEKYKERPEVVAVSYGTDAGEAVVTPEPSFYLDQADDTEWLIKRQDKRYRAGFNKSAVVALIDRLNKAHRPNIEQTDGEIYVCWNNHDKGDKCEFERELKVEFL